MKHEFSEHHEQFMEALAKWLGAHHAFASTDESQQDAAFETLGGAINHLLSVIEAIKQKAMIEGIAFGLIWAGRQDLTDGHAELEQAAVVIMAEHLSRRGGNSEA